MTGNSVLADSSAGHLNVFWLSFSPCIVVQGKLQRESGFYPTSSRHCEPRIGVRGKLSEAIRCFPRHSGEGQNPDSTPSPLTSLRNPPPRSPSFSKGGGSFFRTPHPFSPHPVILSLSKNPIPLYPPSRREGGRKRKRGWRPSPQATPL